MDKDTKDWFTNKLKVLPQNTLRQTEMLVEELEDEDIIAKKHLNMAQYRTFYKKYAIRLFEENIRDEQHIELMLAACGLLAGYDRVASLEERRKKYADAVSGTDSGDSEDDVRKASQRSQKQEKQIMDELLEHLAEKIDSKGHLNVAEKIIKELEAEFGGTIPERLPLPMPQFTKDALNYSLLPPLPDGCKVEMKVRIKGDSDKTWHDSLGEVPVGTRIEHLFRYKNAVGENMMDSVVYSEIPSPLQYIVGSTVLYNSAHKKGVAVQDTLTTKGINIGSCKSDEDISLVFETEAVASLSSNSSVSAVSKGRAVINGKNLQAQAKITVKCGWGPERLMFTNKHPAAYAVFNSIKDNAAIGDERNFVRIVEKNTGNKYVSDLEIEAGKQYEVYIYYQNDASGTYNDAKHNYVGVALGVRVSTDFPSELAKGEVGMVSGKIKADNTNPLVVWDGALVRARESMTLHYVEGSAKIYNGGPVNGSVLSTKIFSEEGTLIGYSELRGLILGGNECASGHIIYTIQTRAVTE